MPHLPRRSAASGWPAATAVQIGAGRVVIGAAFAAVPEWGVRTLGTDTATARRITWLSRMTAGRDVAIGLGTLAAARKGTAAPWLLAGALADTVDGLAIVAAMRQGKVRGPATWVIAAGTAPLAALGVAAAIGLRRAN